mgnify:CR=1 FL=1
MYYFHNFIDFFKNIYFFKIFHRSVIILYLKSVILTLGCDDLKDPIMKDAEAGDAYAALGVAYMYHHGKGYDYDLGEAIRWYLIAAENGCTRAEWEIAQMYRDGVIFAQDIYQSLNHLKNAANGGNPEAQMALALEYMKGVLVNKDFKTSFLWMTRSAKQGVSMAQFYLGYMYTNGIGVDRNLSEAERWFSNTAISGDADMFMEIGLMFEFALDGISRNRDEAIRWYNYGANMGHEGCILLLKLIRTESKEDRGDTLENKMKYLSEASSAMERKERDSAFIRANEYLDNGDFEQSYKNFEKAADLGSPDAMFFMSLMYRDGLCVRRNMRKSLELLARAANAGSVDAQFMLARLYDEGGGLAESEVDAIKYYTMAAAGGYLTAFYYLNQYMEHPEVHVRRSIGKYR